MNILLLVSPLLKNRKLRGLLFIKASGTQSLITQNHEAAFSFDALFERVVVSKLLQSNPAQGLQASEVAAAIHKGEAAGRRKYTAKYSGFYL
jgi:hypothetical protein